jgi:NAD(P)H dehydrogenase (quinone)
MVGEEGVIRGPTGDGVMAAVTRGEIARSAAAVLRDPAVHVAGPTSDVHGLTGREPQGLADFLKEAHRL